MKNVIIVRTDYRKREEGYKGAFRKSKCTLENGPKSIPMVYFYRYCAAFTSRFIKYRL